MKTLSGRSSAETDLWRLGQAGLDAGAADLAPQSKETAASHASKQGAAALAADTNIGETHFLLNTRKEIIKEKRLNLLNIRDRRLYKGARIDLKILFD